MASARTGRVDPLPSPHRGLDVRVAPCRRVGGADPRHGVVPTGAASSRYAARRDLCRRTRRHGALRVPRDRRRPRDRTDHDHHDHHDHDHHDDHHDDHDGADDLGPRTRWRSPPPPHRARRPRPPTEPPPTTTTTTLPPGPEMIVQVSAHAAIATRDGVARRRRRRTRTGPRHRRVRPRRGRRLRRGDRPATDRSRRRVSTSGADFVALDLAETGVYPVTVQIRRDGATRAGARRPSLEILDDPTTRARAPRVHACSPRSTIRGPTATGSPTRRRARAAIDRIIELATPSPAPGHRRAPALVCSATSSATDLGRSTLCRPR